MLKKLLMFIFIISLTGCNFSTTEEEEAFFKVEFVNYDNVVLKTEMVKKGTSATAPIVPERLGYRFKGWDSPFNYIVSNKVIHAEYDVDNHLLEEALSRFEFIFEEGDSPIGVNGEAIQYETSYDHLVTIYCESSDETIIDFNNDGLGIINPQNNVKTITITVYASFVVENETRYLSKEISITVLPQNVTVDKETLRRDLDETIQDAADALYEYYYDETYYFLAPKGDVNILVIPVEFSNDRFTNEELNTINYGFFGDGSQYETVKSYYQKSSYGALNISGDVLSPYLAKFNYSFYENYYSQSNQYSTGVDLLIEEVMNYYIKTNPNLDLSKYDREGDGYIDAVHLVYSAPINYDEESIYWAFQYYYTPTGGEDYIHYISWGDYWLDSYVFSSIDFFYENGEKNAFTIIHETGHLLGLADYYDYTENMDTNKGGLGGVDMMDSTIGDHNAYSKLMLDWIDPIIVQESNTITISKFDTSGDAIIVSNQFNTIFSEYFILQYYTPTGLNTDNNYLNESGLLMFHVHSKLPNDYTNVAEYSYFLEYNNSDSLYKLIKVEEADGDNSISRNASTASDSDLLQEGESYILKYYDNTIICEVTVEDITPESITITFDFEI